MNKKRVLALVLGVIGLILIGMFVFYQYNTSPIDNSSNADIEVVIPTGMSTDNIAKTLRDKNLIRNEMFFKAYLKLNNITNTEFYLGDVSKVIKRLDYTPDTIILDPPRSGISKDLIEILLSLKVKNIIYVSCNPLTLARDINLLDSNYHLKSIKLVDEFPNTYHLESIALLKLKV